MSPLPAPEAPARVPEAEAAWLTDPATFRLEVSQRCRPLLLRGYFKDWPAVRAASQSPTAFRDYLASFANSIPAQAFIGAPDIEGRYFYSDDLTGFNFERADMALTAAMDLIHANAAEEDKPTLYMGSLPTETYLPGFARENNACFVPPGIDPRIWIGNASHVSCHYDTVDNLAIVVAGQRRFTLYPPEAIGDLYIGPIDVTMAGQPVSLAAAAPAGDPRYPRFAAARAKACVANLNPGDALYLPKLWWHQVEATAPVNVLVNYWWDAFSTGPDAPYAAMLLSMICVAERPAAERAAWRAFFDHYVFRPEGHPLAHLPEDKHGILESLKAGNYGRIRATVMQMLRGR